jgi:hypothetical protein
MGREQAPGVEFTVSDAVERQEPVLGHAQLVREGNVQFLDGLKHDREQQSSLGRPHRVGVLKELPPVEPQIASEHSGGIRLADIVVPEHLAHPRAPPHHSVSAGSFTEPHLVIDAKIAIGPPMPLP